MFTVTFEADFRNLKGQFAKANAQLFESQKKSVRFLGERWMMIAKEEAPKGKGDIDPRRSGRFVDSITFEEFTEDKVFGFRGHSQQPLSTYITEGTAPHKIQARNAKALHFFWEKIGNVETFVPKEGTKHGMRGDILFIGKGFVDHPGTKPNQFTARAANRMVELYTRELNAVANGWVRSFGAQ